MSTFGRGRRCLVAALLAAGAVAQTGAEGARADADPARAFFAEPGLVEVRIVLHPDARQQLRDTPREYVRATLHVDGDAQGWTDVGVKLKGAAGSFQKIDERPGFTVHLGKFGGEARLSGLKRFHLNNGAQDDSRMSEWLGGELFTMAGYPAPRVTHAHVWLDGEDLGLYVLRESFDRQFLRRAFGDAHGNLYDGGFCRDIDEDLEKDAGDGPDDHGDLHRLVEACRECEPGRTTKLEHLVDVGAFVDFMALEALLGHWDGYCQNRNNFRLWFGSEAGGVRFLPHGMDQLFGDAGASVLGHPQGIVADAVAKHPEWRKLYRRRVEELQRLFAPKKLKARIEVRAAPLIKHLRKHDRDAAAALESAVDDLVRRVEARCRFLEKHVREPEPEPLAFRGDAPHKLGNWNPAAETEGISLVRRSHGGSPSLHLAIEGRGTDERRGAYRTSVLLAAGRYRLQASARCDGVQRAGEEGGGVRVRVDDASSEVLLGDQRWIDLHCEFEVHEHRRSVELHLELAGSAGKAWFRIDSLRLVRID